MLIRTVTFMKYEHEFQFNEVCSVLSILHGQLDNCLYVLFLLFTMPHIHCFTFLTQIVKYAYSKTFYKNHLLCD